MSIISIASILVSLCAVFAYVNYRLLRLPTTIGIMVIALVLSLGVLILNSFGVDVKTSIEPLINNIDFSEALLHGMLSFLLFAGAMHVNLDHLLEQKWIVGILASFGTIFSTFAVGFITYYLFAALGFEIPLIYALIFGSLISPTDPIAVMAILRKAGVPKTLETKVVGESLFNDGIAVVVFIGLLSIATKGQASAGEIAMLFAQEAIGGVLLGLLLGYITYRLLATVDDFPLEILLTLALVMGGYELAHTLHTSGPIAMVVAGLLIGNHGKKYAMSERTREHLGNFWELVDEFLNAVLFLLIGLELLLVKPDSTAIIVGIIMIPTLLGIRLFSVWTPVAILKKHRSFSPNVVKILTWGGLRGGISVALVLSLPAGEIRDFLLITTYCIVLFSIIVQGLTIEKVAKIGE